MRNTRKFGQILKSKKRPRPTLRSGRGSQINSNTSHQIPVRVIKAENARAVSMPTPVRFFNLHVRFGSKADIAECETNVRFTPKSRHGRAVPTKRYGRQKSLKRSWLNSV